MSRKRGKYLVKARVREMAAHEIVGHIGKDRYQAIKHSDPHPYFFGSTVAHEGVSRGKIEGKGNAEKHWPAGAVVSLVRKVNESAAPVFLGHGDDTRPSYGKVVSAFSENGQAQAVSYIEDSTGRNRDIARRISDGELNAVSIEAELVLEVGEDGRFTVNEVEQVTGLALGDGRWEKPGFDGARVLASVQEFSDEEGDDIDPEPSQEEEEVKLADIVAAIREGNYRPDQIFGKDELMAAEPVKTALTEANKATEEAKQEAKSAADEKEKLEQKNQELSGKLTGYESKGLVADRVKNAKLTEKQAQYVERQLDGFTPAGETEEARQKAVDEAITKHKETFDQFFSGGGSSKGKEQPAGGGGDEGGSGGEEPEDPEDMSDPAVNPLIPGSTAKLE